MSLNQGLPEMLSGARSLQFFGYMDIDGHRPLVVYLLSCFLLY